MRRTLDFEFVLVTRMVLGLLLSEGNSIMPYVKAKDGVDIYYEVYGHGTPFIFLSETACDGAVWNLYQVSRVCARSSSRHSRLSRHRPVGEAIDQIQHGDVR